jgi:hypothetical protein
MIISEDSTTLVYKTRGSRGVDLKSTVIRDGFTLLGFNILLDHLVCNVARADGQISPCPNMSTPILFSQVRKFGQQYSRAYPFQPLNDFADILRWSIRDEHMHMIARDFSCDDFKFMLHCNLSQYIPCPYCYLPCQYLLTVLGYPDEMNFEIRSCVGSYSVKSHGDKYILLFA